MAQMHFALREDNEWISLSGWPYLFKAMYTETLSFAFQESDLTGLPAFCEIHSQPQTAAAVCGTESLRLSPQTAVQYCVHHKDEEKMSDCLQIEFNGKIIGCFSHEGQHKNCVLDARRRGYHFQTACLGDLFTEWVHTVTRNPDLFLHPFR